MTGLPTTGTQIELAARPTGWPTLDTFTIAEAPVRRPAPGEILVRNLVMSVDPYMRGRMDDVPSYAPPYQVGQPLDGGAVGEVVESTVDGLRAGDTVLHALGWREYAVLDAANAVKIDPAVAPIGAYLGVLGMPGLTAYAGLVEVAALTADDVVFVSGAAGAVGSLAGQIAKLRGAKRVIGSAGSAAKVEYLLTDLGFDAAFNYHDGPVVDQLRAAAPDGIDVYFDNVGGEHLEAALSVLNLHGRVTVCGMISQYNSGPSPAPHNLIQLIKKRLTLRGMLVRDHYHLQDQFLAEVGGWIRDGSLHYRETVVDGLTNAPAAFLAMMRGENTGKMLVTI